MQCVYKCSGVHTSLRMHTSVYIRSGVKVVPIPH